MPLTCHQHILPGSAVFTEILKQMTTVVGTVSRFARPGPVAQWPMFCRPLQHNRGRATSNGDRDVTNTEAGGAGFVIRVTAPFICEPTVRLLQES